MNERRKTIRLKAPIGIVYRPIRKNKKTRPVETFVKDLSGGGVCFLAKEEFRAGDLLEIDIQVPHRSLPVRAVGEVVWSVRMREREREGSETAVRFRDIKPGDLHRILEYVHAVGIG